MTWGSDPWGVGGSGGGSGVDAVLESVSPAPGELSLDAEMARWTPIGIVMTIDSARAAVVVAQVGASPWMWHCVYAEDGFAPLFDEHSTVGIVDNGDGTTTYTFSFLPIGGWWSTPVALAPGQFQEAEL